MKDVGQELVDLKKEIVETRNQVIRTDNQVKNVALDVRAFDRRFEALERRARLSGLGTYVLIAIVVGGATFLAHRVRLGVVETRLAETETRAREQRAALERELQTLRTELATIEQERTRREKATQLTRQILTQLEAGKLEEAMKLVAGLDIEALPSHGRIGVGRQLLDLRRRAAEAAYRRGRALLQEGNREAALDALRRSLKLDPKGRYAIGASYLLATQLWDARAYDEVVKIIRAIEPPITDRVLKDEFRYLLTTSLAHLGKKDEAMKLLADALKEGGRHIAVLKEVQAALASGKPIPEGASSRGRAKAKTKPRQKQKPSPTSSESTSREEH